MASETTTPNIGLQVPAFNQANWQVPTDFNWNLLDQMLGGIIPMPALAGFIITNLGVQVAANAVTATPSGVIPGNVYTCPSTPNFIFGFYRNGIFQRPGLDYSLLGPVITMIGSSTGSGDTVFVVYI